MDDNQRADEGSQMKDVSTDITEEAQQTTEVQDGEIVSSDVTTAGNADDSSATVLESLESMIRENLGKIDTLTKEIGQQKEMIDSYLGNDEVYRNHEEAAKAAAKQKTATKTEILKRPEIAHVANKVKELVLELKETKESLNSYLPEYQRLSGSSEIEDENGEPMQIVFSARLIKRRP